MLASSATLLSVTVAFDTNAIQTHPREFASPAVRRLTATARDHLKLRWLVPEMVRLEREQQMREESLKLLRAKANFEFLTQTTFPVTTELIEQRVAEASARQMAETGLKPLRLKDRHIDWALLFADAAARRGLFAEGDVEGEKGFRDRIIAETFLQLPPKSERGRPQRIFFVTDDKGLMDYVQERMGQRADVSVIRNINEMANELNTLNAGLQEQAVAGYRAEAEALFGGPQSKGGLYGQLELQKKLEVKFATLLALVPEGALSRSLAQWSVRQPTFIASKGNQIHFESQVVATGYLSPHAFSYSLTSGVFDLSGDIDTVAPSARLWTTNYDAWQSAQLKLPSPLVDAAGNLLPSSSGRWGTMFPPSTTVRRALIQEVFAVKWSARIRRKKLESPALDALDHLETIQEPYAMTWL
jgi:hypothetical protein